MDIKPGMLVIAEVNGEIYLATVIGFYPCGHVVVSVDGKLTAIPPKAIETL